MTRDPRYDILFEPVKIGPVTAPNRFYQVPHCTGMGFTKPETLNRMRETKAEGHWGVVSTEYCSIHPSSDDSAHPFCTIWDDDDVRNLAGMTERVHRHGMLAACELWYGGFSSANSLSREPGFAASSMPVWSSAPVQTRAMDKADIRTFRGWHRDAALRAKRAGFDLVYVYAGHGYLPFQFLSPLTNQRTDEYGGPIENRVRLIRELIEDTKEAVGDTCGVVCRFAVDELSGPDGVTCDGDGRAALELIAELPDLWDVNISDFAADARTSRFVKEAAQEDYIAFVKQVTTKPVVGVGRFTSPDTMVGQVKRGILDMIGAARPSIADPFLPLKIEEGRLEDIRECIGCNICISGNAQGVPMRCTQNPTVGEEWRRDWHPEVIPPATDAPGVLVVGGGPAGLEAARALGQRGCRVALAEAGQELGGRVIREAALPDLGEWIRVRDWRVGQIREMANVETFFDSRLDADQIREFGFEHVAIATGATWRHDAAGRQNYAGVEGCSREAGVLTPDDIAAGATAEGPVVVYDDDHYVIGGLIAEKLAMAGIETTLVTPSYVVSAFTLNNLEQPRIQARVQERGAAIVLNHRLEAWDGQRVRLADVYTGAPTELACATLVAVTARLPEDGLYRALAAEPDRLEAAGIATLAKIGDCDAPGTIAAAVHAGHLFAREFDAQPSVARRDRVVV